MVFAHITYNDQNMPQDAIDLIQKFLVYNPESRINPFQALAEPFFEILRDPTQK